MPTLLLLWCPCNHHWKPSCYDANFVVTGATSDNKVVIITTVGVQCKTLNLTSHFCSSLPFISHHIFAVVFCLLSPFVTLQASFYLGQLSYRTGFTRQGNNDQFPLSSVPPFIIIEDWLCQTGFSCSLANHDEYLASLLCLLYRDVHK